MVPVGPLLEFSYVADQQFSPRRQRFWPLESFLLSGEPAEGFGSLCLYVSMYCFLTGLRFLSWVLGGGEFSNGFGVLDLSHEEVKQVVAIVYRFFSLHS